MRTIAMLAAAALLSACAPSTTMRVAVEARDRDTHAPMPEAAVSLEPVHFFMPAGSGEGPIVDPSPTASTSGRTDATGRAVLDVVITHPVFVTVLASGYAPLHLTLEAFPATADRPAEFRVEGMAYDGTWFDPDAGTPDAVEPQGLAIRFTPVDE